MIGEHIDYNDGLVLPMAIQRHVVIAASKNRIPDSTTATVYSASLDQEAFIDVDQKLTPVDSTWVNYVRGVIDGFQSQGIAVPAFQAAIVSNIPMGGGLSSSAALEVAVATMLEELAQRTLLPDDKALLCQQVEHEFVGVPCGIMDQFSSVFSEHDKLMLLDCQSRQFQLLPFADSSVTVLIANCGIKHQLAESEYSKRRQQCDFALQQLQCRSWRDVTSNDLVENRDRLGNVELCRAQHVVSEIERTQQAVELIRNKQWRQVGELMYGSHASLRDDYQVSCPELDTLVEIAREIGVEGGVFGSRMTGAGFGGCTVSLVKTKLVDTITETLQSQYLARTGLQAACFPSRPASGVSLISPRGNPG